MLSFNVNVTRVGLEIGCFTSKQLEEQIKQIFKNQLQTSMVNRSIINSTMPYTTVYVNGLTLSNERERDPSWLSNICLCYLGVLAQSNNKKFWQYLDKKRYIRQMQKKGKVKRKKRKSERKGGKDEKE